jgi:hypothetical protein
VSIPAATGRSGRAGEVVALSVALLQVACSTTYQPRHTGRVGMVIHHGAAVYVKDGRELPLGPFSGDLEGLVADVPAAAAHAHTAHTQFAIGVPTYMTGLAGVVVGIVVLSGPIGWVVIGVGAATAGTGLGFMGTGLTHAVDAVNIHNDAASDLRPAP